MPPHSYLRWPSDRGSWHVLSTVTEAGWRLRCGKLLVNDKATASDHLPAGEKTCETCATATLRDEDRT